MNARNENRPSVGRMIFSCIAALILGVLHPFLTVYQVMMPMALPCVGTMTAVALYASAGLPPVILLALAGTAVSWLGLGTSLTVVWMPLCILPAVVAIVQLRGVRPFFIQLRRVLIACLGGTAASVLLAALFFGADIVSAMMTQLEAIFESIMPEIWKVYGPTLATSGVELTYEEFASTYFSMLKVMQQYYQLYLPANLLTGAALTGTISVLWGNWISARRGRATAQSFLGLHEWFMPSNMTYGVLMTLAAAFVLKLTPIQGSQTAWMAVEQLAELAFGFQALASNDRRMKERGSSRRRRTVMAVLVILCAWIFHLALLGVSLAAILAVMGCASALFGRKGALRAWLDKNQNHFNGNSK